MKNKFTPLLNAFKKIAYAFDDASKMRKVALLEELSHADLPDGMALANYQDVLLYQLAHPCSRALEELATRELKRITLFMKQTKQQYHEKYHNTGLPYACVRTSFSFEQVDQLLHHKQLQVELDAYEEPHHTLNDVLRQTLPSAEREMTSAGMSNNDLLEYFQIPKPQHLSFIVEQLKSLQHHPFTVDYLFDGLSPYVKVKSKDYLFSRAWNKIRTTDTFYHDGIIKHFDHEGLMEMPVPAPIILSSSGRRTWVNAIKNSLILTARETDPSTYLQEESLRVYELERGIAIALYSIQPIKQLPYESYVGYTLFKNGLPAAYGGAWVFGKRALFGINIFEPYRGGESGFMMCQLLRTYKQVMGVNYIEVEPYQYGLDNPEGISSGAFWFYYRYGFRPLDKALKVLADKEYKKIKAGAGYRSPEKLLLKFTESNIAWSKDKAIPLTVYELSTRITDMISKKYKGNRQQAVKGCVEQFLKVVKKSRKDFSLDEQRVLEEVALWHATLKLVDAIDLKILVEMIKQKPLDWSSYQQCLLQFQKLK